MKRFTALPAHELVPVDKRLDVAVARGFWWCRRCGKVTTLVKRDLFTDVCRYCESAMFLRWHRPEIPA